MEEDRHKRILKQYWGYDDFRGIQREIIESIASKHDTLGLMPTGGGKSITFQVPALAMHGTCIVITPLIALMKDQVQSLRHRHIKATCIHSGMSHDDILTALENCILGDYKFLYVSPERLEAELFQKKLSHMHVSFITVDEAHCISQWGYDFRPSYLQIANIRKLKPDAPILALTASATPKVVEDIQVQLSFRPDSQVFRMSFERKNLTYITRETYDKWNELLHILRSMQGSAIVYTRNRRQTQELAEQLVAEGFTATNYHAGLQQMQKDERQQGWQQGYYRVMVATNAFGMGIDKPDVRLVLHYEIPDSPEAYFQEAGRAGRDGLQSYAVLLYNNKDCGKLLRRIRETYPEPEYIRNVYEHMCYYLGMAMDDGYGVTREFNLGEFCARFKHFPVVAHNALLILKGAGYIDYTEEEEITSRLRFTLTRDELYRLREADCNEETITNTLLRIYSGLFADFVYIDEYRISRITGIDMDTVYFTLKGMARKRIVEYIPTKRTNYITFTTRRVETEDIVLPRQVYADRLYQYAERIEEMVRYVTDKDICHSHFLLSYFGEKHAHDCGKCEFCHNEYLDKDKREQIKESIRHQLAHGPVAPTDINITGFSRDLFAHTIQEMIEDEEVRINKDMRLELI